MLFILLTSVIQYVGSAVEPKTQIIWYKLVYLSAPSELENLRVFVSIPLSRADLSSFRLSQMLSIINKAA